MDPNTEVVFCPSTKASEILPPKKGSSPMVSGARPMRGSISKSSVGPAILSLPRAACSKAIALPTRVINAGSQVAAMAMVTGKEENPFAPFPIPWGPSLPLN